MKRVIYIVIISFVGLVCTGSGFAENIDPHNEAMQYVWGENVGWLNFEPNVTDPNVGTQVSSEKLAGFIWAENIGWINLSPASYGGVVNDGTGNLSGYAWGENVGWINFDPNVLGDSNDYGVTIDADGAFDGYAWGENIGWINFGIGDYYVVACKVTFEDLANFVDDWLKTGSGWPADLYNDDNVDFKDYSMFTSYWQDYCPDSWPLK